MNNLDKLSIEEVTNLIVDSEWDDAPKTMNKLRPNKNKFYETGIYIFRQFALELDKNPPRSIDEHTPMPHY